MYYKFPHSPRATSLSYLLTGFPYAVIAALVSIGLTILIGKVIFNSTTAGCVVLGICAVGFMVLYKWKKFKEFPARVAFNDTIEKTGIRNELATSVNAAVKFCNVNPVFLPFVMELNPAAEKALRSLEAERDRERQEKRLNDEYRNAGPRLR